MKKELQDKLYKDFPNLYAQKDLDMTKTAMCWGICCGNGWYDIIRDLSEKLEPFGVQAVQVKEKFGGLRFYLAGYPKEDDAYKVVMKAVREAEEASYKTCELCGAPGKSRDGGWVRVLCDDCESSS